MSTPVLTGGGLLLMLLLSILSRIPRALNNATEPARREARQQIERQRQLEEQAFDAAMADINQWAQMYCLDGRFIASFPVADGLTLGPGTMPGDIGRSPREVVVTSEEHPVELSITFADTDEGEAVLDRLAAAWIEQEGAAAEVTRQTLDKRFANQHLRVKAGDELLWATMVWADGRCYCIESFTLADQEELARHFHESFELPSRALIEQVEKQYPPALRQLLGDFARLRRRAAPTPAPASPAAESP